MRERRERREGEEEEERREEGGRAQPKMGTGGVGGLPADQVPIGALRADQVHAAPTRCMHSPMHAVGSGVAGARVPSAG